MQKAKKGIPANVARRGNPDEIRFFMGLADGVNVAGDKLPEPSKVSRQDQQVRSRKHNRRGVR